MKSLRSHRIRPPVRRSRRPRRTRRTRRTRRGTAVVEFAICLPVLVLIVFGSIEACNSIFLKQALTEAAYQGALSAMKSDATQAEVETRINAILTARGITHTTIDLASGNFSTVKGGDTFTIQVTADAGQNRIVPTVIANLFQIDSTVTLVKQ